MDRSEVYEVIDTERDFQNEMTLIDDRTDMIKDLHIGDTLTAIRVNLAKAEDAWYKGSVPHENSMEYLRKIAGLVVQAGERYGIPEREKY